MRSRFPAAPWSKGLKLTSAIGTTVLVLVAFFGYLGFPMATGATRIAGSLITVALGAIFLGSILFAVTGYAVEGNALHIERPFFSTRVSLLGLRGAWLDPTACKGAIRLFGNAGLYGFTGLYRNRKLGTFRLFGTDLARPVVLALPQRTVVITPAVPDRLIAHMHHLFPGIRVTPEGSDA
ncbi:MAG: PH domain-containing protein [Acidiferrobacterales bacterium]